ncbi:MAG TPA: hypothetical protein VEQ63_13245, partial [Bryobacteraceae bacterium]|nr:hypothetical protein [Bryobacteraceae bacterium]
MRTSLALVHHANQYLITNGYDNREGIEAVVGTPKSASGLRHVLELHERFGVPLNLHISGTLIEAIAWHRREFLDYVKHLVKAGLIELVGSCYGQNIMRFFGPEYNRSQLNEELVLYRLHLDADPHSVKTFWPPERVWETRRTAPVLRDAKLLNDGYRYVILDDRLLLSPTDSLNPRKAYDDSGEWNPELFKMHEIEDGLGLVAFPIGTRLRRSIPPRADEDWEQVQSELEALLVHSGTESNTSLLAVYADDMEKVAGIGEWGPDGPKHYESFLSWLTGRQWVEPVRLTEWAELNEVSAKRKIERGTFQELAVAFEAGEGYERWFLASDWAPYRGYFNWAEARVRQARAQGGDTALLELADKQLLVANWETAWHTPAAGPHGDPHQNGHASPWARALTSHSRHAAVTADAALWMSKSDRQPKAFALDIDNDGETEVVIANQALFVVLTPKWGGRITAMFSVAGRHGAMVIGNPCDDWNWMEELNRYMDVPRNHPGALADAGFEHDEYEAEISVLEDRAVVRLRNIQENSQAFGLVKEIELRSGDAWVNVRYLLPQPLGQVQTELGLSPDYLGLLRCGAAYLETITFGDLRGCKAGSVSVY